MPSDACSFTHCFRGESTDGILLCAKEHMRKIYDSQARRYELRAAYNASYTQKNGAEKQC